MAETPHDPKEYVEDPVAETSSDNTAPTAPFSVPEQGGNDAAPIDPMEYVTSPVPEMADAAAHDPLDDFDPYPLPDNPDETYDRGMPTHYRLDHDPKEYRPGLDLAIDEYLANQRIVEMMADPVDLPDLPLPPGTVELDENGLMVPGPWYDPAEAHGILVDMGFNMAPFDENAPEDAEDQAALSDSADDADPDPLSGGDGDDTLMGFAGKDMTTPRARVAAYDFSGMTKKQATGVRTLMERHPDIIDFLETPAGREKVLSSLQVYIGMSDQMMRVRGITIVDHVNEFAAGVISDAIGGAIKGFGRLVNMAATQQQKLFFALLAKTHGEDVAEKLKKKLSKLEESDPEGFSGVVQYLAASMMPGAGLKKMGDALVRGGELLDELASGAGIPAGDKPASLEISRMAGQVATHMGLMVVPGGAMASVIGGGAQMAEHAYQTMKAAGIDQDDPVAPLIMTSTVILSAAMNTLPFGRLAGKKVLKALGGTKVTNVAEFIHAMPEGVQKRFTFLLLDAAKNGADGAITGFVEETVLRTQTWAGMSDEEQANHTGGMWEYVLKGQAKDAEVNAVLGAVVPALTKTLGALGKKVDDARRKLRVWGGQHRDIHQNPYSLAAIRDAAEVFGMRADMLVRRLGQAMVPELVMQDLLLTTPGNGNVPMPKQVELQDRARQKFQGMSVDDALDMDRRSADTSYNPNLIRDRQTGAAAPGLNRDREFLTHRYVNAEIYGHAAGLNRQMSADSADLDVLAKQRPELRMKVEVLKDFMDDLRQNGGLDVRGLTAFSDAVRARVADIRAGRADGLDLNDLVARAGDERIAPLLDGSRERVMNRPEYAFDTSFRRLRALDPTVTKDQIQAEAAALLDQDRATTLDDPARFAPVAGGPPPRTAAELKRHALAHAQRAMVEKRIADRAEYDAQLKQLKKTDPARHKALHDALKRFGLTSNQWHPKDRPLKFTEEGRFLKFVGDYVANRDGQLKTASVAQDLQRIMAGPDVLATTMRFRFDPKQPEQTLTGLTEQLGFMVEQQLLRGPDAPDDRIDALRQIAETMPPETKPDLLKALDFIEQAPPPDGRISTRFEAEGIRIQQKLVSLLLQQAPKPQPEQGKTLLEEKSQAAGDGGNAGGSNAGGGNAGSGGQGSGGSGNSGNSGGNTGGSGGGGNTGGGGTGHNNPPGGRRRPYKYVPKRYKKGQSVQIDLHENAGGHLGQRHIGKTIRQLRKRLKTLKNRRTNNASSFPDISSAEYAISEAMKKEQHQIDRMLKRKKQSVAIEVDLAPYTVGVVVNKGTKKARETTRVRLYIVPDNSLPGGYRIHTGYPIP